MAEAEEVVKLGLPWPWRFHKIAIRGDTVYWWAHSPRTFAIGCEFLQDGFIAYLGPLHFGWGSMSAAKARNSKEPSHDR